MGAGKTEGFFLDTNSIKMNISIWSTGWQTSTITPPTHLDACFYRLTTEYWSVDRAKQTGDGKQQ